MRKKRQILTTQIYFRGDPSNMFVRITYTDGTVEESRYDATNPLHMAIFRAACREDPPTPAEREQRKRAIKEGTQAALPLTDNDLTKRHHPQ